MLIILIRSIIQFGLLRPWTGSKNLRNTGGESLRQDATIVTAKTPAYSTFDMLHGAHHTQIFNEDVAKSENHDLHQAKLMNLRKKTLPTFSSVGEGWNAIYIKTEEKSENKNQFIIITMGSDASITLLFSTKK